MIRTPRPRYARNTFFCVPDDVFVQLQDCQSGATWEVALVLCRLWSRGLSPLLSELASEVRVCGKTLSRALQTLITRGLVALQERHLVYCGDVDVQSGAGMQAAPRRAAQTLATEAEGQNCPESGAPSYIDQKHLDRMAGATTSPEDLTDHELAVEFRAARARLEDAVGTEEVARIIMRRRPSVRLLALLKLAGYTSRQYTGTGGWCPRTRWNFAEFNIVWHVRGALGERLAGAVSDSHELDPDTEVVVPPEPASVEKDPEAGRPVARAMANRRWAVDSVVLQVVTDVCQVFPDVTEDADAVTSGTTCLANWLVDVCFRARKVAYPACRDKALKWLDETTETAFMISQPEEAHAR